LQIVIDISVGGMHMYMCPSSLSMQQDQPIPLRLLTFYVENRTQYRTYYVNHRKGI